MEEGKVENWFEPKRRDSRSVRALILDGTDDILFDVRFRSFRLLSELILEGMYEIEPSTRILLCRNKQLWYH